MFDIDVLEIGRGVGYGSSANKVLKGADIPEIDLLVRESIQNCSDASLTIQNKDVYRVQFNTGLFCPSELNQYVTELTDELNRRYSENEASFIEIRDEYTLGLTGPTRLKDISGKNHGNFFKLLFDTGINQTQKNAGGNWGYGKSVYFRAGIGLVIFYSQIKTEDGYESRMMIALTEDQDDEKKKPLLNSIRNNSAGKAWWGIKDGKDLLPLTDKTEIIKLLNVFNVKPFAEDKTGTSIIIPYIDKKRLLEDVIPEADDLQIDEDIIKACVWKDDFEEYLKLAVQRWYAPKISNLNLKEIPGIKRLNVYVNGTPITADKMYPIFQLVQELYTTALARNKGIEYKSEKYPSIETKEVKVIGHFDLKGQDSSTVSGYVAAIKITDNELNGDFGNVDPCIYTRNFISIGKNDPIIMYARDPGMVVEYATNGPWLKGFPTFDDGKTRVIAFYVPNVDKPLKKEKYEFEDLGDYLRSCESAKHSRWEDKPGFTLVLAIQRNLAREIKNLAPKESLMVDTFSSNMSTKLGKNLFPALITKKAKSSGGGSRGSGESTKSLNVVLKYDSKIVSGNLEITFTLLLKNGCRRASISLLIESESGKLDAISWKNQIGTEFPLEIVEAVTNTGGSNLTMISEPGSSHITKLDVHVDSGITEVTGTMILKTLDKKYVPSIKVE